MKSSMRQLYILLRRKLWEFHLISNVMQRTRRAMGLVQVHHKLWKSNLNIFFGGKRESWSEWNEGNFRNIDQVSNLYHTYVAIYKFMCASKHQGREPHKGRHHCEAWDNIIPHFTQELKDLTKALVKSSRRSWCSDHMRFLYKIVFRLRYYWCL